MQLKPGMKGIIIKPTYCCNNVNFVGKVVLFERAFPPEITDCVYCSMSQKDFDLIQASGYFINSGRIKWFNDDIDLEDTTEEVTKEIADVTQ